MEQELHECDKFIDNCIEKMNGESIHESWSVIAEGENEGSMLTQKKVDPTYDAILP